MIWPHSRLWSAPQIFPTFSYVEAQAYVAPIDIFSFRSTLKVHVAVFVLIIKSICCITNGVKWSVQYLPFKSFASVLCEVGRWWWHQCSMVVAFNHHWCMIFALRPLPPWIYIMDWIGSRRRGILLQGVFILPIILSNESFALYLFPKWNGHEVHSVCMSWSFLFFFFFQCTYLFV